ncbi:hypothetical protein COLO4_03989 [Corchorus olitorius]|uniref:Uncharacterized protein n=1 Tax=Corchorus olitorius TaxID=93759 RepID=A0A1R3KVQ4_9ROSI|nr:hypothetical protein COLO4_03989 [Corchorus olitorius]
MVRLEREKKMCVLRMGSGNFLTRWFMRRSESLRVTIRFFRERK